MVTGFAARGGERGCETANQQSEPQWCERRFGHQHGDVARGDTNRHSEQLGSDPCAERNQNDRDERDDREQPDRVGCPATDLVGLVGQNRRHRRQREGHERDSDRRVEIERLCYGERHERYDHVHRQDRPGEQPRMTNEPHGIALSRAKPDGEHGEREAHLHDEEDDRGRCHRFERMPFSPAGTLVLGPDMRRAGESKVQWGRRGEPRDVARVHAPHVSSTHGT